MNPCPLTCMQPLEPRGGGGGNRARWGWDSEQGSWPGPLMGARAEGLGALQPGQPGGAESDRQGQASELWGWSWLFLTQLNFLYLETKCCRWG